MLNSSKAKTPRLYSKPNEMWYNKVFPIKDTLMTKIQKLAIKIDRKTYTK